MGIPQDEFHGVGGSYLLDAKTGKRTQVEKPTAPSPDGEGGARDPDGKELNTFHDALEPAFAAPAAEDAAEPARAPARRFPRSAPPDSDTSASS